MNFNFWRFEMNEYLCSITLQGYKHWTIHFLAVTDYIPRYEFDKCVARHFGDYHTRAFTCYNQFPYQLFGQLITCQSMRGCLFVPEGAQEQPVSSRYSRFGQQHIAYQGQWKARLPHIWGFQTLSDWTCEADVRFRGRARRESARLRTSGTWLHHHLLQHQAADLGSRQILQRHLKMHTAISLRGSIPVDIHKSHGKWHGSNILDVMDINQMTCLS